MKTTAIATFPVSLGALRLPVRRWLRTLAERRRLASLDARMLQDIGLDDATAAAETERPFWELDRLR
ncbi:MAG: hypothetical protein AAF677_01570 [Pseudomonadota bacterium]